MSKLNFTINDIVSLDFPTITIPNKSKFNIDCPFCGRKKKLNINTIKNVWACPACGAAGGMLDLHARMILGVENPTTEDRRMAAKNLDQALLIQHKPRYPTPPRISPKEVQVNESSNAFNIERRSIIYEEWLKLLPLSKEFETELKSDKRGNLTDSRISELGYKTNVYGYIDDPEFGHITLAELAMCRGFGMKSKEPKEFPTMLINYFRQHGMMLPGFMLSKNFNHIMSNCYTEEKNCGLLPVRWRHGEISFLQTKLDPSKTDGKKYGRFSSSGKYGCSTEGLENIHYTRSINYQSDSTPEEVWLTEGILKADIADQLSNRPFIALVGITSYKQLPDELNYLKKHGTKRIVLATDMDYLTKDSVAKSMSKIKEIITESGLDGYIATWDAQFKGIDDYLTAVKHGIISQTHDIEISKF